MKKQFSLFLMLPMMVAVLAGLCSCESGKNEPATDNQTPPATFDKVETLAASNVSYTEATLAGRANVDFANYQSIAFGVSVSKDRDVINRHKGEKYTAKVLEGKEFEVTVQDLSAGTDYYYCAWLFLNGIQYEYGEIKTFTTKEYPGPAGVQMVDLGLSVKWANMNVGATNDTTAESWYGDYFAWGETTVKSEYNWSTYKWCNGSYDTITKYCANSNFGTVDNKTVLEAADDAARVNWGGSWRMPTKEEQDELCNNCTWTWKTNYNNISGLNGYVVTGTNGKSIFLPAAGYRYDSSLGCAGSYGYYWSGSLHELTSYDACYLILYLDKVGWYHFDRHLGQSVRPVCQ